MKACHITSVHKRYDGRIFLKECSSLAKAGFDVTLLVNDRLPDEIKNGVKIVSTNFEPKNRLHRMLNAQKSMLKAAKKLNCQIYHLHDPELLPVGLKLKSIGKKVIFDSHEIYTEQLKNKYYLPYWVTKPMAALYGVYERHVLNKIDAVIVPCTMMGKNPFEGKCKRVVFLNNLPILNEFYNRCNPSSPKNKRQICYVGSLTESRGISLSIKAAHKANAALVLAGSFSNEQYQKQCQAMKEYSCVDFRGQLNRSEVFKVLSESNIGLMIALDVGQYLKGDNLATKAYEYMSMGLPIILSNSPYNDYFIKRYKVGLCVNPGDINEIADAVSYLLSRPDEAKRMGENGRSAIKNEFNWGIEEQKLVALYKELAQGLSL